MKTICSTLVAIHYREYLMPLCDDMPNLQHYYNTISNNVKTLFHKSLYLQGGLYENVSSVICLSQNAHFIQGKTFNLAHTILSDLCERFYFQGKNSLAMLFPDDFESLPKRCLAMATTCVYLNSKFMSY